MVDEHYFSMSDLQLHSDHLGMPRGSVCIIAIGRQSDDCQCCKILGGTDGKLAEAREKTTCSLGGCCGCQNQLVDAGVGTESRRSRKLAYVSSSQNQEV